MPIAQIRLIASPGAKESGLEQAPDGRLRVRIAAPAVDGRANKELIRFLAAQLDLPPSALRLAKGSSTRFKTVEVDGLSLEEIERSLGFTIRRPPRRDL